MPKVIPKGQRAPTAPLSFGGASSIKYIGMMVVINPKEVNQHLIGNNFYRAPADRPPKVLPTKSSSKELALLAIQNIRPEMTPSAEETAKPPFRPIRSASKEPDSEPIVPPIRKIETMEDHMMSNWLLVKVALYREVRLSLQNCLITCKQPKRRNTKTLKTKKY